MSTKRIKAKLLARAITGCRRTHCPERRLPVPLVLEHLDVAERQLFAVALLQHRHRHVDIRLVVHDFPSSGLARDGVDRPVRRVRERLLFRTVGVGRLRLSLRLALATSTQRAPMSFRACGRGRERARGCEALG